MYIQSLIANTDEKPDSKFDRLKELYIAFIQVGGAHAHNYKRILDYLNIKTVIFTDTDYIKDKKTESQILDSNVTNSSLNYFYKEENVTSDISNGEKNKGTKNPNVKELIKWKDERQSNLIKIQFQDHRDYYGRTLEESMISKLLNERKKKFEWSFWEELRKRERLEFSIPNKEKDIGVRDIVESTGNSKKTDFMYSVISEKKTFDMLPNYIEEGLNWLQNQKP